MLCFNKQLQPAGIFDWLQRRPRGTLPTASVPSPEVTAPFCLVPSPEFSQAPEYSLPDHLCRFGGTIVGNLKLRGFSWKRGINCFTTLVVRHHISALSDRICLITLPTCLNRDDRRPDNLAFSVPHRSYHQYGNINPFPIDYAFQPRLGVDSPCPD